jgi:RHS repeat-associated protein
LKFYIFKLPIFEKSKPSPEAETAIGKKSNCAFITGYERDNETNLDYARARMFGSGLGRFTSPDDFLNDTQVEDPQSWNLYAYVRNNPLRLVDPDGEVKRDANGNVIKEERKDEDPYTK